MNEIELLPRPEHSYQKSVVEFHEAMGQPVLTHPQVPSDERVRLRARLVIEEALELVAAMFHDDGMGELLGCARDDLESIIDAAMVRVDLVGVADALADITYVVEGSYLEFGIDGRPVFDEVHRANMAKASGEMRPDGKRLKPPGWTPPDIAAVLERQMP